MSQARQQLDSILIADCGSTMTKVVLLDIIDGQHRFVAYAESPSTVNDTWGDVSVGVTEAILQLEETTGRTLFGGDGQLIIPETPNGVGIDGFFAISSAAEPLRVVLVGLARDISLASARRAVLSTYARIEAQISLEQEPGSGQPSTDDDKISALWHASPEVVCVVGGTDGGAEAPVLDIVHDIVAVALYLIGEGGPSVIFAGNEQLRDAVTKELEDLASLQIVDNVRPQPDVENIGSMAEEIELAFYDRKLKRLPGVDVLNRWSRGPVLPTARTAEYTIRYCDRAWNPSKPALGVDIGSASVTLNVCQGGRPLATVRNDIGTGYGVGSLLEQVEMDDILRWLPFELDGLEARHRLLNRMLKPDTIPHTREDLLLELAAARQAVRLILRDALPGWPGLSGLDARAGMIPACDPLVGSGGLLAHVPYHGYAALLLLDALQPVGISELYLDEYNLLASLGAVASAQPLAMVQTLRGGGLAYLGTAIAPIGHAGRGDRAVTVRAISKETDFSTDVQYGSLAALPLQFLASGTEIEVVPSHAFDIGLGPGRSYKMTYRGGSVGLIVDARGRPLVFDDDPEVQRSHVDGWLWEMMGV
jgi:hypothetical protein